MYLSEQETKQSIADDKRMGQQMHQNFLADSFKSVVLASV
jgi:hypothetical protein